MKLTTKGRYAVTAMLDLALNSHVGPVSLAEIPGGGYRVSKALSEIVVADIISAVDESVDATHCGGKENCRSDGTHRGRCLTHDLWAELSEQIEGFLSGISLQDLINRQPHATRHLNEQPLIQQHTSVVSG